MNTDMSLLAFVRPTLLKVVKAHMALKNYGKAIEEAEKHVNNEASVEGLHALGAAQQADEQFDAALRTYQKAFEIAVSVRAYPRGRSACRSVLIPVRRAVATNPLRSRTTKRERARKWSGRPRRP